jgi:hypothetical protein
MEEQFEKLVRLQREELEARIAYEKLVSAAYNDGLITAKNEEGRAAQVFDIAGEAWAAWKEAEIQANAQEQYARWRIALAGGR